MKISLACALVLGLSVTRVCAQTGGTAIGQLLEQVGRDAAPVVVAVPAAALVDAGASASTSKSTSFAKCTGAIPYGSAMVPIALDFLRENAGKGTMELRFAGGLAVPHEMRLVTDDERGTMIELYAAFDSKIKFAEFLIPRAAKSRVSIYALEFRAEWATVDCVR